jgi:hypothetical protein
MVIPRPPDRIPGNEISPMLFERIPKPTEGPARGQTLVMRPTSTRMFTPKITLHRKPLASEAHYFR